MDIGAIADDFTGATDLATALQGRGYRVAVTIGAAPATAVDDVDVVVVALKSRTAPVDESVSDSLAALRSLREGGARQIYVKYCSTFDSTDAGNIGPVLDAVMNELGTHRSIVVPAFPDNGRTVFHGHLFVGDDLLENSSMRHHPLTPMTRSRLRDVLRPQTSADITEIPLADVRASEEHLRQRIADAAPGHIVIDAIDNSDLEAIASASRDLPLVSGGAGLALGFQPGAAHDLQAFPSFRGRKLVVCGSASARTRAQITEAQASGLPMIKLDIAHAIADSDATARAIFAQIDELNATAIPVVYSVGDLEDVQQGRAAAAVENTLAEVVRLAVASAHYNRIIVAGGETSGAVVNALGIKTLRIGPRIAPGVCWSAAATMTGSEVAIALKSGNFGAPDMFTTAWSVIE